MPKCVLVCNPNSGKNNKKDLIQSFTKILNKKNYDVSVYYTRYSGHAEKIVTNLDDDVDLLISLGGDGTFNEVLNGNDKRKKKLLITLIPLGTTNDIASMLGMGKDPINNLKMCLSGVEKKVDYCKINDRCFFYTAGLGKFTNIPYETTRNLKKNLGYFAYLINALKAFNNKTHLFEMQYTKDGETYKGLYSFILICNATRIGGFELFQDIKLDDGKIEVLMTNITKRTDIIKSLLLVRKLGDASKVPGFYFFRTDNLKITLSNVPRKSWCIDGEDLDSKSKTYNIKIEKGLRMLVPKEAEKIFKDRS